MSRLLKIGNVTLATTLVAAAFVLTIVAMMSGCAAMTPMELIDARAAYQSASTGPAAELVPAELHKAHEALNLAEKSFQEDADSYRTRDLAYVAERKAQLAVALSTMASDKADKAQANAAFQKEQTEALKDANDELADLAAKEDARGTVITLSGSVLFQSGQSTLLPTAQTKLDQVGHALSTHSDRFVVVEGYTDSQGSDSYNQSLSQRRADEVRNYLVLRGYDPMRIQAQGMGETSPIADNTSAEGRANNRRVEIIILNSTGASR